MTRYVPSHFDNPSNNWKTAVKGLKLFIYYKNEMSPRFIFQKSSYGAEWRGYGQSFPSVTKVLSWCIEKKVP